MTSPPSNLENIGLRALVAEAVRDVVADMLRDNLGARPSGGTTPRTMESSAAPRATVDALPLPSAGAATGPGSGRARVEIVRIAADADLDAFARHLLKLFENAKNRQDLRTGRLRFSLSPTAGIAPGPTTVTRRVSRGAVTERVIEAAHFAGESLVLTRGAILTPLGRERARELGVIVEKEH